MKITYLSDDPFYARSMGKIGVDLFKLFYPDSDLVQIVYNRDHFSPGYPSHLMGYNVKYPFSVINYLMPKLAYGKSAKHIEENSDIIHYVVPTCSPIIQDDKSIVTVYDMFAFDKVYNEDYPGIAGWIKKKNIKKSIMFKNITTASKHVKWELISRFGVDDASVSVIYPPISDYIHREENRTMIRLKLDLPLDRKLVLSNSSAARRKNLPMVEAVMTKLGSDFQLVRVGPKVGDSITFGAVDGDTLNKIYNACDVLLFPTLAEGFGLVTTESFATGLPVVSSDIEVIREVAGDSAVLVDPLDVDQNVEGILKAIENKEYYRRKGFERAKLFSRDTIKEQLIRYYRTILE